MWDVGGQEKVRPLWRPYTRATDAVVFVVDSCDDERMEEAKLELHRCFQKCPSRFPISKNSFFNLLESYSERLKKKP